LFFNPIKQAKSAIPANQKAGGSGTDTFVLLVLADNVGVWGTRLTFKTESRGVPAANIIVPMPSVDALKFVNAEVQPVLMQVVVMPTSLNFNGSIDDVGIQVDPEAQVKVPSNTVTPKSLKSGPNVSESSCDPAPN